MGKCHCFLYQTKGESSYKDYSAFSTSLPVIFWEISTKSMWKNSLSHNLFNPSFIEAMNFVPVFYP